MTRTKYQIVVDMVRAGHSRRAIAEQLGTNVYNIHNCIKYARSLGMTVQFDMDRVLLATAPPHIEQWLRAQAPEGATAGDMILAILNDAYSEEIENE
jgi:hypothetical protein